MKTASFIAAISLALSVYAAGAAAPAVSVPPAASATAATSATTAASAAATSLSIAQDQRNNPQTSLSSFLHTYCNYFIQSVLVVNPKVIATGFANDGQG